MRHKGAFIVSGILVIGAAVAILTDQRSSRREDARLGQALLVDKDVSLLNSIEIKKGDRILELVRDAHSRWHFAQDRKSRADARKVLGLVEAMTRSRFVRMVSESTDQFSNFGLSAASMTVKLRTQDRDVLAVNLGEQGPAGGRFVAIVGEKRAYLIDPSFDVAADEEAWESKVIADFPKEQVKAVAFFPAQAAAHGQPVTLERGQRTEVLKVKGLGENWREKAGVAGVEDIVSRVLFSKRWDVDHELAKKALTQPSKAFVTLFDGRTIEVQVGETGEKEKEYFLAMVVDRNGAKLDAAAQSELADIKADMERYQYQVPADVAQRFIKGAADFIAEQPLTSASPDEAAAAKPSGAKATLP